MEGSRLTERALSLFDDAAVVQAGQFAAQCREIEEEANSLLVDEAGSIRANEILGQVATVKKEAEKIRTSLVKPLNDRVKEINSAFKSALAPLNNADKTLRGKLLDLHREQERRRREEEERVRKLLEEEQKKREAEAKEKNKPVPPPPPIVVEAPPPIVSIKTDSGTTSIRKVWDWELVDINEVPREWLILNDKAVNAAVRTGIRNIPGIRIFEREQIAVRGR